MFVITLDDPTPRLTHREARQAIHADPWIRLTDHRILSTRRVDDNHISAWVRERNALVCEDPCTTLGPDYFRVFDKLDYRVTVKARNGSNG